MNRFVIVTTDGGAGSSGKGSLNSWLAERYDIDIATNNWMSNAGHYTELDDGRRFLVQHVPSAFVNLRTTLYINAGAAIDLDILKRELDVLDKNGFKVTDRLFIHPHANIITEEDKDLERSVIKTGSTFKGCGAAIAGKSLRQGRKLAKDCPDLDPFLRDMTVDLNKAVADGTRVLIEGSQGVDLDINFAEYPFCTSRQTHPTQLVADAGLPCQAVTHTVLNMRTYPIRISKESAANPDELCYSGNYWDAKEISWHDVALRSGWKDPNEFLEKYDFAMTTSVTKKIRRVFEFSRNRLKFVHALCGGCLPDNNLLYSLNFVNFIDRDTEGKTDIDEVLTDKVEGWIRENMLDIVGENKIKWIRTGPRHNQIIELDPIT